MSEHKKDITIKALNEIERQLERSGYFTHSSLSTQAERINEIESFLYGMIDTLIDKGVIEKNAFEETVRKVREETLKKKEHFHAGIAITIEGNKKVKEEYPAINCAEQLPVCKAVCCRLNFALTVSEIESDKVKWDLGQPYFIRQNEQGYCTHLKTKDQCCSVYEDRPNICRKYSCSNDKRIWNDFEKMELNHTWINENLKERKIHLHEVYMIPEEEVVYKSKTK